FIYTDVFCGIGGLPVGSAGKALVLLSGGIDSPVAAYFALKRGVRVDFIHFHSIPYTSQASNDKVISLARILNKFQNKARIFLIPLADIQKEAVLKCPEKLRIILYRRMMLRIAEAVAGKNRQTVLYTGEVVSQVASQTLENIRAVNEAIKIPIIRPLSGFDKSEIIKKAREIGTYATSVLPHEDCCTRFMPKNPETKGKINEILEAEKSLNIAKLAKEALEKAEIMKI
ncbi:MAG: 7-cyano-7-deazaguanine synthase, partial [Candidatus Moraniibacteriota bacterium]